MRSWLQHSHPSPVSSRRARAAVPAMTSRGTTPTRSGLRVSGGTQSQAAVLHSMPGSHRAGSMPIPLRDKVVLITGASSGFGEDAALLFAEAGCQVIVAARRLDRLQALVEKIQARGGQAFGDPSGRRLPRPALSRGSSAAPAP